MKKRIRKTGEIVDVITYNNLYLPERHCSDSVSYIDSKGVEHHNERGLNLWWDFEDVDYPINCDTMEISKCGYIKTGLIDVETLNTDIDWEQRKYEVAEDVLSMFFHIGGYNELIKRLRDDDGKSNPYKGFADALIAELKKGGEK